MIAEILHIIKLNFMLLLHIPFSQQRLFVQCGDDLVLNVLTKKSFIEVSGTIFIFGFVKDLFSACGFLKIAI